MIFVIMCGGQYDYFKEPKALTVVNGEPLVARTIRLLKDNGVPELNIAITSNYQRFADFGVQLIEDENNTFRKLSQNEREGYWLDAFYRFTPDFNGVTYLFGDVYYTQKGISTIVTSGDSGKNTLFGTYKYELKPWEEPLAYKVWDLVSFYDGIDAVKKLHDEGKCARHPIVWELYRYLNGIDVNKHILNPDTYIDVQDGGMDVDSVKDIERIEKEFEDS